MIRRSRRPAHGWTTFSNAVLADPELSFRALGILVYVLSKPDDWTVRSEQLAASHSEGRDAVRTALEHLELAGYVRRERWQDERGRWHTDSVFYDHPHDRNLGDICTEDGFPGVGEPVVGEPGVSTRTEEQGLRTRSTTRGASRRRGETAGPKPRRQVHSDETPDDDGPALGASPRPAKAERNDRAAQRGTSGVGLALRLQRGLEGKVDGSAATVDVQALGSKLSKYVRQGSHTWDQLAKCVELFVAAPDRYRSGDMKGWTQFLAAMPKLEADAAKHLAAEQGGARYGGAYDGVTE